MINVLSCTNNIPSSLFGSDIAVLRFLVVESFIYGHPAQQDADIYIFVLFLFFLA